MESNKTDLPNGFILKKERIIIKRKGRLTKYGFCSKFNKIRQPGNVNLNN